MSLRSSTGPKVHRFTAADPCPICGGWDAMRRGQGERCHGFMSSDGKYAHCAREELSGGLPAESNGTFAHRLHGPCHCGVEHNPADPAPRRNGKAKPTRSRPRKIVETYDYQDSDGKLISQTIRYDPKGFAQRRPDGRGGWIWNLDGVKLVPYRLPELLRADSAETSWVPEGEKAVNRLRGSSLVATCNPMGAGKWSDDYSRHLAGRHVVILPDNDDAGRKHAEQVARSVAPHAASVKILELPGLPPKGDVCDFLDAGGTVEDLRRLADEAPPFVDEPNPDPSWPPLRLGKMPAAEPFPVEVLPEPVRRLVAEAAGAVGCDPGMVAGPVLAIAAGIIGRSASLMLSPNRFASASVYHANVALPGDGKSPALAYAMTPVEGIDARLADDFAGRKSVYLDALRVYQATTKARKAEAGEALPPKAPIPQRIVIDDATIESVFRIMAGNERGLIFCKDELASLILGLNQYKGGKGNDRPNLLKAWAGAPVLIDRVLNDLQEPIRIPYPHLCITGNIPPALLVEMVNRRGDDGFIDRWLFVYPERRPRLKSAQRRPVSDEAIGGWNAVANNLWNRPLREHEGKTCPHVVKFTAAGRAEFDRLYDEHVDEVNDPDFPDELRGSWSKLEVYAGRLCLILAMLGYASDPPGANPSPLPDVTAQVVRDAWRLVSYFKGQARRVRACLHGRGLVGMPEGARLALNWVRNHPEAEAVALRELTRTYPPERGYDRAMMEDGLAWLERQNALRQTTRPGTPTGKPGRKPGPTWDIHPDLRDRQHNQQIQQIGGMGETLDGGDSADSADYADVSQSEASHPVPDPDEVVEWTA